MSLRSISRIQIGLADELKPLVPPGDDPAAASAIANFALAQHTVFDKKLRRFLATGAAIGLSLAALTGCTSLPTDKVQTAITIVATATSAEPRVALSDSLAAELTNMAKQSKRPGDATVRVVFSATGDISTKDLTPLRPNGQVQHATADADRQIAASVHGLADQLAEARAGQPGLDLLGLLDRASQVPGDIAVISSGITTAAPVDLRVVGWNTKPDSVIDSIARQGLLPHLAGRHVTFHGLGIAGESQQPRLPPFARTMVEQLWTGICQRAEAASCTVAHDAPSAAAPVSTLPVPVVPVPDAITEGGCPVWASLSDHTLHFSPESAVLPANADDALRPIVVSAASCDIQSIDITGHIADTGSGQDDSDLSGRRARAVAERLVALGLPTRQLGSVTGKGASEPVMPDIVGGVLDELRAQQNRRVELTFHRGGQ
ncbi:OmpA family protein [Nocardia sp. BSTN01]|uniref:OmpA family protein n=1 Tax=Nocardia sp. BSTN01 TaxID=2783665 RepID=UPI00188F2FF6|nr:OmpA family protein [Nocardia sp. BSTN01]MBF4996684.1 OmpA family protein [Nocardia sp. BSTN01]